MSEGNTSVLGPPLKMEIEDASGHAILPTTEKSTVIVRGDKDFLDRLRCECCSSCRPRSSYFHDNDISTPPSWHHIPWDEFELKVHDLVDTKCQHVQAAPPLDEVRIRGILRCGRSGLDSQAQSGTVIDDYTSDATSDVESSLSGGKTVEGFTSGTSLSDEDSIGERIRVKKLLDGGRMISIRGKNGCKVRIIENDVGERVLVTTRCCGRNDRPVTDSGISASLISTGEVRSNAQPFALMSGEPQGSDRRSQSELSTWSAGVGKPLAFESVVEEGADAPSGRMKSKGSRSRNRSRSRSRSGTRRSRPKSVDSADSQGTEQGMSEKGAVISVGSEGIELEIRMRVTIDPKLKEIQK